MTHFVCCKVARVAVISRYVCREKSRFGEGLFQLDPFSLFSTDDVLSELVWPQAVQVGISFR